MRRRDKQTPAHMDAANRRLTGSLTARRAATRDSVTSLRAGYLAPVRRWTATKSYPRDSYHGPPTTGDAMDSAALLARLGQLADLSPLLAVLRPAGGWQPLPPDLVAATQADGAWVARRGAFEWLALTASPAAHVAERLSLIRSRQGRLTGVIALDRAAPLLAIAITLERTVTATFRLDHPSPADCERLRRLLALPHTSGLDFALRVTEALGTEDAGRRFFVAFRDSLDRMAASLPGTAGEEERRSLALIQLTRVLFLYFVQAKGWLDGRTDFLRQAVDDALARRRRLHRDLFRPLFFGTLNRRPDDRGRARAFGRIPFLNGGLFEPHPLERNWRTEIPNAAWRDAFDGVFERFHFTVHENSDPGRIAPDMLGRVFEGLMAPADRRGSGAFYTPAALVARMVEAGLEALLAQRLGLSAEAARRHLDAPDREIRRLFRDVTVLDPAVGSGAFLLEALERLAQIRLGEDQPAKLRRGILERNLFGVDQNPMAVRLAELRLWLAVIAVEDTADPARVEPLPNLDGVVRQGDSLLDPASALGRLTPRSGQAATELRELRRAFVLTSGPAKRDLLRHLRGAERRAFQESLEAAEQHLERQLTECLDRARSPSLFGGRHELNRDARRRLRDIRARMTEVRRLKRRLRREGGVPWFSYEVHFGDVLAQGGFDLVLGNPPWVRAEHISPGVRAQLQRRYRWWRGAGRGFQHQPDLALAFVERASELLAPSGVLALLLPAKTATAGYAKRMRAFLGERFTLHAIADLTDDPLVRFEATTYPAALIAARARPEPARSVRLTLEPFETTVCPQRRLTGGAPWVLLPTPMLEALAMLHREHPPLGLRFTPQLGVKTGANSVFLEPPADVEGALIRQALRGRDIHPFRASARLRLFFPHAEDGAPYHRLPPAAARHVASHEALLYARVDFLGGPPWCLFRVRGALAPHRVVWADLARRLGAVALTAPEGSRLIPLNSCYLVQTPDRRSALAVSAWLNSTWIRVAARASADVAAGGYARFNARVIADVPLPASVLEDDHLVHLADRAGAGEAIQEELDARCAEHLALPDAVRDILLRFPGVHTDHRG